MSADHSFIVKLQKELGNIYSGSIPDFVKEHFSAKGYKSIKNTKTTDGKS